MNGIAFVTVIAALLVAPVGGAPREQFDYYLTGSAGTAILGEFVYSAQAFSATSADALANPFNRDITLERNSCCCRTWEASSPTST